MLTKAQLIDSVIELNPGARREWLAQFAADALREYFERLQFAAGPRGTSRSNGPSRTSRQFSRPLPQRQAA
ncbi:MAG: hypothetical protein KF724_05560 [Phycisphaeraceae bacterium]|nr:hypothetical protein [Phycisphaeraceae bacterium]